MYDTSFEIKPYPDFSWSMSRQRKLDRCPRAFYCSYYLAWNGWLDDAPAASRMAYRLAGPSPSIPPPTSRLRPRRPCAKASRACARCSATLSGTSPWRWRRSSGARAGSAERATSRLSASSCTEAPGR